MAKSILSEQLELIIQPIIEKYYFEINDEYTRMQINKEIERKIKCNTSFGNDAYKVTCKCDITSKGFTCNVKVIPLLEENWQISKPLSPRERPGKILTALRLRAEMTQKELAEKVGLSVQTISKMEQNKQEITPEQAKIFAKLLASSEEYFVNGEFF